MNRFVRSVSDLANDLHKFRESSFSANIQTPIPANQGHSLAVFKTICGRVVFDSANLRRPRQSLRPFLTRLDIVIEVVTVVIGAIYSQSRKSKD